MTAQKKVGAKTAAKGGLGLEVGIRFDAGTITKKQAKAFKDQLVGMAPEMVAKLPNAPRMRLSAKAAFQRSAPSPPPLPIKRVKKPGRC